MLFLLLVIALHVVSYNCSAISESITVNKLHFQTRHNFVGGNPYFFSENLCQSVSFIYASMYSENFHAIHIAMQFTNKSRHFAIKIDSQQQRTKIGALLHMARQSD